MKMSGTGMGTVSAISTTLLFVWACGAFASEKQVKLKDLPKAVQKTVQEQTSGAKLVGLSKETENGKVIYEVETTVNGRTRDLLIDAKGEVVEVEEEVALDSLPPAIKSEIQAHADKIIKVETVTKSGKLEFYEAQVQKNRKKAEVQVTPDGKLITKKK